MPFYSQRQKQKCNVAPAVGFNTNGLFGFRTVWATLRRSFAKILSIITKFLGNLTFCLRSLPARAWTFKHVICSSWRRPPFALWLGPPSLIYTKALKARTFLYKHSFGEEQTPAVFFLAPDGLLLYFRLYALLYSSAFIINCDSDIWSATLYSFASYLLIAVGIPHIIYGFLRAPLLTECDHRRPELLNDWFSGIPSRSFNGQVGRISLHIQLVRECVLPYTTIRQASYWTRQNFQQTYYLRAAMAELFETSGDWFSPGFMRWLFYYCAPVWSTYLVLILLTSYKCFPSFMMAILGIGWWLISAILILREVGHLTTPLLSTQTAKRLVPSSLWPHLERYISLKSAVPRWGIGALTAISSIALLAFLQMLSIPR